MSDQAVRMQMQINAQSETIKRLLADRLVHIDLLTTALPYVECWEGDNGFKPGVVSSHARKIRAAIEAA